VERQESHGAREIEAALTGETSQHRQAAPRGDTSGPAAIEDAYLRRAIAEMGELADEIAAEASSPDGSLPVMSSGAPQAEIAMVKRAPGLAERQEGVAFFGRAGTAILKSVQRLDIDPLELFGTLVLRHEARSDEKASLRDLGWLRREIQIIEPKIVVAMGEAVVSALNDCEYPLAQELTVSPGEIQRWTASIEVLVVPDIDLSLDDEPGKRAFWRAFRVLGDWHKEQPPY
jgi:uracil-DNA glycosylase family 4